MAMGQHLGILTGSPESPVFPRLRKATISKQTKNEEVARGRMPSCCKLAVFTIPCLCPCDCCYLEHPSFPSLPGRLPHSPRCSPAGGFFMKPTSSAGSDASFVLPTHDSVPVILSLQSLFLPGLWPGTPSLVLAMKQSPCTET